MALRLITWNCNNDSLSAGLADLMPHSPDIVFLQECTPVEALPLEGRMIRRRINQSKGVALGALSTAFDCSEVEPRPQASVASVAAKVVGPLSFTVLGIWAQGKDYVGDVLRTIDAYKAELTMGPAVVMGDLNSGTNLMGDRVPVKAHMRIVDTLKEIGLVSAYHEFNSVEHGLESHATYNHLFKASQPWHIDFCFIPSVWAHRLTRVDVLEGSPWDTRSDHRPLIVEVS